LFNAGRSSYLSANICDEFINILGNKVFEIILAELKESKYYSISVDSTPDVSHIDQLTFCVRYVKDEKPIERFLQFIAITEHTSAYLSTIVMAFLRKYGINLLDCRGQSYDNANNMAGEYSGLQRKILNENNLAIFLPCAAHSLNLIGANSVSKSKYATNFFIFVESLYLFFVHSTYRWNKLKETLTEDKEFVLKRATGTRWSAKKNAINALHSSFPKVIKSLMFLQSDDCHQTDENKSTARGILKKLCKFETIFILILWDGILHKFDKVNISFQKLGLDLSVTVKLFESLVLYLENLKLQFDSIFENTKALFDEHIASDPSLLAIIKNVSRTRSDNTEIDKSAFHKDIFLPIIGYLLTELNTRRSVYTELYKNFDFLVRLNNLDIAEITTSCKKVSAVYKNDISESELINECEFAKQYFFLDINTDPLFEITHASMYATIIKDKLVSTFPNIEILLRVYLCMFITNVTDERSFSKLKYIKNYLRNSLTEDKLNSLSLICIEKNVLNSIDMEEIIDIFLNLKMRKLNIETR
jgi:hypothetical protein